MRIRRGVELLVTVSMTMGLASLAYAQDDLPRSLFETTFFGGYRFGGSFEQEITHPTTGESSQRNADLDNASSYGIALNWQQEPNAYYELSYSKSDTTLQALQWVTPSGTPTPPPQLEPLAIDMTVEYLLIGGYVTFAEPDDRAVPYFLLTVGAARYIPDTIEFDEMTKFAMAIGGGVKFPITKHIGIRLDGRVYATFFENSSQVFCKLPGSCAISLQGETVLQPEASLGVTFGF